jgi:UDPglucose--hexose-1-phosphate uridylyltransferase
MAFRRHLITGEPIVFAPERAARPNAFGREHTLVCPFCPGNESLTPPEIARRGDPWRIRVFPNKYPAVDRHEIIVESNDHDATFDRIDHAAEVLSVYVDRYGAHAEASYVSLFKNEGERAGASIDHLHSQVMALPMIPARVAREGSAFEAASSCPLCAVPDNVIAENEGFIRFAPAGSQHPYEQWIIPKRHQPEIVLLTDGEVQQLATILQSAVRATRSIAAAHNILFMNFPRQRSGHFYIDVFPRLTAIAGFELATGTFIDIIDPAAAARRLK